MFSATYIHGKFNQATWEDSYDALPMHHIDILKDWPSFQRSVAEWLSERRWAYTNHGVCNDEPRERNRLACEVVQESRMIWGGVGVYTVVELFHMAGTFLASHLNGPLQFCDYLY